jgi:beta-glucosidase-like glycosyl hydrolase/CubicO group peptidase (beta-lactamase class C family)
MKLFRKITFGLLVVLMAIQINTPANEPPFLKFINDPWVEQKLNSMPLEAKVAQLLTVAVFPSKGEAELLLTENLVEQLKPGGIIVMQSGPKNALKWINRLQAKSGILMLVTTDAEWGLTMRFDSTLVYPNAQALGAANDTVLVRQMGYHIGLQLKRMGIHLNYSPVADINLNPANPVISFRSFGESTDLVTANSLAMAKGLQQAGIIAVAKHFPGHGDTGTDSHRALPVLSHSRERLETVELLPFIQLIKNDIPAIMTGHLNVRSLDSTQIPSSLSKTIVTGYLKNQLGFKGLIITDALNMIGAKPKDDNQEVEALLAGNDMLAYVTEPEIAAQKIMAALKNGTISEKEIDEKCRKILALKRWVNLHEFQPIPLENLNRDIDNPEYEAVSRKLIHKSLTVTVNRNNILPVQGFDTLRIASVAVGADTLTPFQEMLSNYTIVNHFYLPKNAKPSDLESLMVSLRKFNLVILGIQGIRLFPNGQFGTTEIQRNSVSRIISEKRTVTTFFGNAYALGVFEKIQKSNGLIIAYQNTDLAQQLAAQLIFGGNGSSGKLPVTIDSIFKQGAGINLNSNRSLTFGVGEEVGIHSMLLKAKIDSLAKMGLDSLAYPGCQVLVARNGKIILHKCYGYHTFDSLQKVQPGNLYDFASVTKVTAALPAIIRLTDQKKINLDAPISRYWPDFKGSNKENLILREILAHQSGLPSGINFYAMGIDKNKNIDPTIFSKSKHDKFTVRVADHLYMHSDFSRKMRDTIRNVKLLSRKRYVYSDLSFHLYPEIITNLTKTPYEDYLSRTFYKPLGANSLSYNPYKKGSVSNIIPTENDKYFRHENLRGFVHDESAAMMGGVSGNAGLFGTTLDLAKVFQMYLQKGYFGGRRYFSEKTFNEFNRVQFPENENRRGLGFDKPALGNDTLTLETSYPGISASKNSFGHSGYTGTFVWADPDAGILFIYMTNRVHPTRQNNKLSDLRLRVLMHQAIYDSLIK